MTSPCATGECSHVSEYECCLAAVEACRVPKEQMQSSEDVSYNMAVRHAAAAIKELMR